MATIKVNVDELSSFVTRVQKYLDDYQKTYKKLFGIIDRNDAKLDATTQTALLNSCNGMKEKFDEMISFLNQALEVTDKVAKEFKEANEDSYRRISGISI